MRAAYYETFGGPITIENLRDPAPVDHSVILKVLATGLCLSDWHGWKGHDPDITLPHVPGHELVGEIVELGKGIENWKVGQRVTTPFVGGCGKCNICNGGNPQVCPDQFQPGFTHWGSFAEYVSIHFADYNLIDMPDAISNEAAAILGCRFATSFRGLVDQGKVSENQTVAIFGCGGVGLSAIMIARAKGATVIAIDRKKSALDKALEIGADKVVHVKQDTSPVNEILDLSNGGADLTIDAIGHAQVLKDAIRSLNRRGRHVQIGLLNSELVPTIVPMERIIAYELEIYGSHGMQASRYPEMLDMIVRGKLQPELLVDEHLNLEAGIQALPDLPRYMGSGVRVINQF